MAKISFDLNCTNVAISPNGNTSVNLFMEGVDKEDLFDNIDIDDTISHYGYKKILDEIGEEEVRKYFNIPEE